MGIMRNCTLEAQSIKTLMKIVFLGWTLPRREAWSQNTYLQITENMSRILNLSDCWIGNTLPQGGLELPFIGIPTRNWTIYTNGMNMNGSCVYGKWNTREGRSFDLDLPLSEIVMILGRCLVFKDKI